MLSASLFQSCPTLGDPMDCSPPASSVHGILQARTGVGYYLGITLLMVTLAVHVYRFVQLLFCSKKEKASCFSHLCVY